MKIQYEQSIWRINIKNQYEKSIRITVPKETVAGKYDRKHDYLSDRIFILVSIEK